MALSVKAEKAVIDKMQDGRTGASITRADEKDASYLNLVR